jgi:hypothetical protein
MGKRVDPREVVRHEGREQFAFLVSDSGFAGPEETERGLVYRRGRLWIELRLVGPREPEVDTTVRLEGGSGALGRWASLDCLYVAFGCGTLQDVPGSAATLRTVAKRVRQHAAALHRVLPALLAPGADEVMRRCQGRQLPAAD